MSHVARPLTTIRLPRQHVRRYVRWGSPLVPKKISVREQVLPQTEIRDRDTVSVLVQHKVAQLEVTMNNVPVVESPHGLCHIIENLQGFLLAQAFLFDHVLLQVDQLRVTSAGIGSRAPFENQAQVPLEAASVHRFQARFIDLWRRILSRE